MLEKLVKKHVESKMKGENQIAKLLMTKLSLEELAKKFVEDKLGEDDNDEDCCDCCCGCGSKCD